MADSVEGTENAAFWLPTHFLTDNNDDFPPSLKTHHHNTRPQSGFGSDPFDFSSVSSNDNDENITPNDDVSLLSHLTRHLAATSIHASHHHTKQNSTSERPWMFSTSPQSTLSGYGGGWSNAPSRVPSPPLTPELKNDAAWDLLYEAAGQVARLKMNAIAAKLNNGLLVPPRHSSAFTTSYDKQYQELKCFQTRNEMAARRESEYLRQRRSCGGSGMGIRQSAWPDPGTRQHMRQSSCGSQLRGLYHGGGTSSMGGVGVGVKRSSTGTGVFLPRSFSNSAPGHHPHPQPQPQPQYRETCRRPSPTVDEAGNLKAHIRYGGGGGGGYSTEQEIMVARRNAILVQQRRNVLLGRTERNTGAVTAAGGVVGQAGGGGSGHEIRLPNDWTY